MPEAELAVEEGTGTELTPESGKTGAGDAACGWEAVGEGGARVRVGLAGRGKRVGGGSTCVTKATSLGDWLLDPVTEEGGESS